MENGHTQTTILGVMPTKRNKPSPARRAGLGPQSPNFLNRPNPYFPALASQPASTSQIASSKICKPSSISAFLTLSGVANRMPLP